MAPGDVFAVETGGVEDIYYVDTGMYDTPEYGSVYVVDADRVALVDTGIGTNHDRILGALDGLGIGRDEVEVLAVTHVHLDHAGGAGFLARACPNATVAVHERGARHLVDPARLWEGTKAAVGDQIEFYTEPEPVPEGRIRELTDGTAIDLGDHELRVHHAPGHAPHQVVFEDPGSDCVFTADAAGIYVPAIDAVEPTTPPPQFDLEQALDDVGAIRDLDPATLCYAHYGPAPAGDRLDEYETVLNAWVAGVEEARAELGDDGAVVDRFAEATELDAVWSERKARNEAELNVRGVLAYLDGR
jgi:glyoxylase-like metal-dependent hydrolase (beta-lactamase superfamily II)